MPPLDNTQNFWHTRWVSEFIQRPAKKSNISIPPRYFPQKYRGGSRDVLGSK